MNNAYLSLVSSLVDRVIEIAIKIQQIPAPTFHELPRATFIYEQFQAVPQVDVKIDDLGNVYARLPGKGEKAPVVVSAHTDTVFPATTELSVRRDADRVYGPGIGDNALGVASLFGLLWALQADSGNSLGKLAGSSKAASQPSSPLLPGDLWLVANIAEEGLGDLRGIRAVVDRFGNQVSAYLVLEGMALGQVYHRALAVQRYRISMRTRGGHSWVDFGRRRSAVHELAELITQLTALELPSEPRTSLNVGVVQGGTSINTIAAEAWLELDLRSEASSTLKALSRRVRLLVDGLNQGITSVPQSPPLLRDRYIQVEIESIGSRPSGKLPANHPLVRLAIRQLQQLGIQPNLAIGSTDANLPLSRNLPALCLGITSGNGAHSTSEYINIEPVSLGLAQLMGLVKAVFTEL